MNSFTSGDVRTTWDTSGDFGRTDFIHICAGHNVPARVRRLNQHAAIEGGPCHNCGQVRLRKVYFTRREIGRWYTPSGRG